MKIFILKPKHIANNLIHFRNLLFATFILLSIQSCGKLGADGPDPVDPPGTDEPVADAPTTANFDKLAVWNGYKTTQSGAYNLVFIGDSYTQGNYFTWRVRSKMLTDGGIDGGPGYCSFGRWDATNMLSIDGSMDSDELTFTYDPVKWKSEKENTLGPCDYVINNTANAVITVTSKVALNTLTIIHERHANAGDFRYRINSGSWITVNASNAVQGINNVEIDVSGAGSNFTLDIEPEKAGEIFCGVLAKRTGNVLTFDKVGSSGANAGLFAKNPLWKSSMQTLAPNGAVIMFGINEMEENITPAQMKIDVQNIIDKVKEINPACDIMIMCPPATKFETEEPHKYKVAAYADILYKLAVSNKAAFINFPKLFGTFSTASVTSGLMNVDRIHPGEKGGELIATTIFSAFKK